MTQTPVAVMLPVLREILPEEWRVEFDRLLVASLDVWERRETLNEEEWQQLLEQWFALGVAAGMHNDPSLRASGLAGPN